MMMRRDGSCAGTKAEERKVFVYGHGLQAVGDGKGRTADFTAAESAL